MGCLTFATARFWDFPRQCWVVVAGLVTESGRPTKPLLQRYLWCLLRALALIVMWPPPSPTPSGPEAFSASRHLANGFNAQVVDAPGAAPPTLRTCVETDGWCAIETWITLLSLYARRAEGPFWLIFAAASLLWRRERRYIGSLFYAALISNISAIVGDMNVSRRRFEEMVQTTDEYMLTKNIPGHLRERVREFYHLRYAKGRIFDEPQILGTRGRAENLPVSAD